MPIASSSVSRNTGTREWPCSAIWCAASAKGVSTAQRDDVDARHHHVGGIQFVQLEDVDEKAPLVRIDRRLFVVLLDQLLELLAQAVLAVARAAELSQPVEQPVKRPVAVVRGRGALRSRQP